MSHVFKKKEAEVDVWMRALASSNTLGRRWLEMENREGRVRVILSMSAHGGVTPLYAARGCKYNNAVALGELVG